MKYSKGFTLIELMIVVSIISILAGVAVPQFQEYTIRSRVIEGLILATSAKRMVAENAIMGTDDYSDNWFFAPTDLVDDITLSADGVINIDMNDTLALDIQITLTPYDGDTTTGTPIIAGSSPENNIGWLCETAVLDQHRFVPVMCRN